MDCCDEQKHKISLYSLCGFFSRQYFLRNIREEAASLFKEDVESTRMLEEFKIKYNTDKKNSPVWKVADPTNLIVRITEFVMSITT